MNLVPNKQLLVNAPFQLAKNRKKDLCVDNKVKVIIAGVYCPTCRIEKCAYISTIKWLISTTVKSAKPAATFWMFLLRTKKQQLCCLAVIVHIVLRERRVATTKKKNHLHFWRNFSATHNQAHPNLNQKRQKLFHLWHGRVGTPLVDTINQNIIYILVL